MGQWTLCKFLMEHGLLMGLKDLSDTMHTITLQYRLTCILVDTKHHPLGMYSRFQAMNAFFMIAFYLRPNVHNQVGELNSSDIFKINNLKKTCVVYN